ncbi:MAG: glycosyltransferase [Actinomycetota bacterium]|nr:glycosyltransferase [Actinomycetota bacterium]
MRPGPSVSCIIVAFHRPEALAGLLDRLRHPQVELVVVNVDNDPTVAAVAGPLAVALPGNPGYATAVNAGVGHATADVVVFLNDDVSVDSGGVLSLASVVADGRADVVLPCVLDGDGRREPTIAALPSPGNLFREWFLLPDARPRFLAAGARPVQKWRAPVVPEPIEAGAATVVAVAASLIRELPLPQDYFLYWEESDWFWRLRSVGARVLFDPRVVVRHAGGRDDVRPAKSRLLARNAVRCVRRTQGRRRAVLAWLVVILWNARLVALDGLRRLAGSPAAARRLPARTGGLAAAVGAWREL